jgi:hypothetical protein
MSQRVSLSCLNLINAKYSVSISSRVRWAIGLVGSGSGSVGSALDWTAWGTSGVTVASGASTSMPEVGGTLGLVATDMVSGVESCGGEPW